jgi:hypothetical protein
MRIQNVMGSGYGSNIIVFFCGKKLLALISDDPRFAKRLAVEKRE